MVKHEMRRMRREPNYRTEAAIQLVETTTMRGAGQGQGNQEAQESRRQAPASQTSLQDYDTAGSGQR